MPSLQPCVSAKSSTRRLNARARASLLAFIFVAACGGSDEDGTAGNCADPALCVTSSITSVSNVTQSASEPTGSATEAETETDTGGGSPACDACGADQVCVAGQCADVPAQCPCPIETYCELVSNMCVIGCTRDEECDEGRICDTITRKCSPGCREDAVCGAGQICEGLMCITGCRTDAACGPMEICDAITCRPGCNNDEDCSQDQVCDGTVCRVGCTTEAECPDPGEICDLAEKTCRAGCNTSADCPLEKVCDLDAMVCEAGCDSNAKCGAGKFCDSGQCSPGCFEDAGCPAGQACEANECVAGDESPYNDCVTTADCSGDSICINKSKGYQGSFCSPVCNNKQCPAPAPGVEALGAQCIIHVGINLEPTHCAVVCDLAGGSCGPKTECEDRLLPPQMGINPGICTHPI